MFYPCKVTVVKRMINREIVDTYLNNPDKFSICNKVEDNQEFIIHNPYEIPEGLCASAWADIRSYIITIAAGGEFKFLKEKHTALASCTDLFRPVIFKIERL